MHPSAEVADVIRELLFVLRLAPRADLPLLSSKRPKKSTVVDGAVEPSTGFGQPVLTAGAREPARAAAA